MSDSKVECDIFIEVIISWINLAQRRAFSRGSEIASDIPLAGRGEVSGQAQENIGASNYRFIGFELHPDNGQEFG